MQHKFALRVQCPYRTDPLLLYSMLDCPNLRVSGSSKTDAYDTRKHSTAAYRHGLCCLFVTLAKRNPEAACWRDRSLAWLLDCTSSPNQWTRLTRDIYRTIANLCRLQVSTNFPTLLWYACALHSSWRIQWLKLQQCTQCHVVKAYYIAWGQSLSKCCAITELDLSVRATREAGP